MVKRTTIRMAACTVISAMMLSVNVFATDVLNQAVEQTDALSTSINFAMNNVMSVLDEEGDTQDAEVTSSSSLDLGEDVETTMSEGEVEEKDIWETSVIADVEEFVYIRRQPNTEAKILGKLYKGSGGLIVKKGAEWTKIESASVTGYVKNEFLAFGDEAEKIAKRDCRRIAEVTTTTLRVREKPSQDSPVVTLVGLGSEYKVGRSRKGWVQVRAEIGEYTYKAGWISTDFVSISYDLQEAISVEEERAIEEAKQQQAINEASDSDSSSSENASSGSSSSGSSSSSESSSSSGSSSSSKKIPPVPSSGKSGQAVANFAVQFIGNPYKWGGTSLTNGADCSGFVWAVYQNFGYSLNRSSSAQASNGRAVSIDSVEPGDLIFYGRSGVSGIGHVGIYIGGGQIVHASTEATGIKISNYRYKTPICARRII